MKKFKLTFRKIYLIYVAVLVVGVIAALIYVNNLLHRYEDTIPEALVEASMDELKEAAASGNFWSQYGPVTVQTGSWEADRDVQQEYLKLYQAENLKYTQKKGDYPEDEMVFLVKNGDVILAEVALKANGPAETKLAILTLRDWAITSVQPIFEAKDYTMILPPDFSVEVNGKVLKAEDGEKGRDGEITYTLQGLYLPPQLVIRSQKDEAVLYTVDDNRIVAEYYDYTLSLPSALTVKADGKEVTGTAGREGITDYRIRQLTRPEIVLEDGYGNSANYQGGNDLELTHLRVLADSRWKVQVAGAEVPERMISVKENPEYNILKDYVAELPKIYQYEIAVLQKDAEVILTDMDGNQTTLDNSRGVHDMTKQNSEKDMPEELAAQVDVLARAQDWSLFMSADLPFAQMEQNLIKDSYQYQVARKYSHGVDITFISDHILLDPVFTENKVSGYEPIAENAFCVDISFVKHMRLRTGKPVDDYMNDRFYFVKYDDSEDGVDNPTWKIAGMKEIVNND